MKKRILIVLTLILAAGIFAACAKKDEKVIRVGATPSPHAEILEIVRKELADDGWTLEIEQFSDYVLPNLAVEEGQLDANYFQHILYLNGFNEERGTHLVSVAGVHYEPMGIYGGKSSSLESLPDGAVIAVPNDATNEARALLLLQQAGLLTLREGAGISATKADIAENPHGYQLREVEAKLIPSVLRDVDIAVINGNYAIDAGLKLDEALASESATDLATEYYQNVLCVKAGNEQSEKTKALVRALQSDAVREYIRKTYNGAVVPLF